MAGFGRAVRNRGLDPTVGITAPESLLRRPGEGTALVPGQNWSNQECMAGSKSDPKTKAARTTRTKPNARDAERWHWRCAAPTCIGLSLGMFIAVPLHCRRDSPGDHARRAGMHTVTEIEERIRQRYRQPKGVEQFGIEPVPSELKTVRWHDIFAII